MAEIQYTPNSKWSYPVYPLGEESSLQLIGDQSSSISELSGSTEKSPSPSSVKRNLQLEDIDSDSEEELRRTPSPGVGGGTTGGNLVQSPPAEGLTRPKCASSPFLVSVFFLN